MLIVNSMPLATCPRTNRLALLEKATFVTRSVGNAGVDVLSQVVAVVPSQCTAPPGKAKNWGQSSKTATQVAPVESEGS